jgi:hypothetical protein
MTSAALFNINLTGDSVQAPCIIKVSVNIYTAISEDFSQWMIFNVEMGSCLGF